MDANTPPPRIAEHEIHPVFLDRWSPRAFSDAEITETELLAILEAARWAPSSYNGQPWRFVYALRGGEGWDALLGSLLPFNAAWAAKASALLLVTSYTFIVPPGATEPAPNHAHSLDTGAAWGYLALAATLAGWHTHAMGGFDRAKAAEAVGLPADHVSHAVVALGKQGDPSTLPDVLKAREHPTPRKPLAETAFKGKFPG
jgi:nitroreductase